MPETKYERRKLKGLYLKKIAHTRTGYLHAEDDDTPYDVALKLAATVREFEAARLRRMLPPND